MTTLLDWFKEKIERNRKIEYISIDGSPITWIEGKNSEGNIEFAFYIGQKAKEGYEIDPVLTKIIFETIDTDGKVHLRTMGGIIGETKKTNE